MKKFVISALLFPLIGGGAYAQKKASAHGYPIDPVPFTSVKLTDSFWGPVSYTHLTLPTTRRV